MLKASKQRMQGINQMIVSIFLYYQSGIRYFEKRKNNIPERLWLQINKGQ